MSFEPVQSDPEALAHTLEREASRLSPRDLLAAALGATVFFGTCAFLLARQPPGHIAVAATLLSMSVLVVAQRVRIDTPFGFTLPTQLGFVPLLFAAPLAVVPLLVWAALLLGALVEVARGSLRPGRLVHTPGNCAFALGPALVFVLSGTPPRSAGALLLLAALLAQFAADTLVYALRSLAEGEFSLRNQVCDLWVYGVDAALSGVALVVAVDVRGRPATALSLLPLLSVLAVFARERRRRLESTLELSQAYRGTALVLGDVVEADDGYTGEHCKSVVALALAVADELGLDPAQRRNLEFGALLHDVGKIAIPKEIINKPGKLTSEEWTVIRTHTVEGQRMLDRVGGFMHEVGLIVRSHHERWDGTGYPDGLAGTRIPLEARIIACCDTWNAMRTDRAYRSALSYEEAMAELLRCAGSQLDTAVVRVLIRVVERDERQDPVAPDARDAGPDGPAALAA